jgi:methyltransferase (TIGR00027 family)
MGRVLVEHISDTAFWVAHYRAIENARPDALFRDPFAERLAGERGRNIALNMPMGQMTSWVVSMRTCIIDAFILDAIAGGVDTVINVGSGLDARPFRMGLPANLTWVDADFPAVIEYKRGILVRDTPQCQLQWAAVDLTQRTERQRLLTGVAATAGKIVILTEGVVPYLKEEDVADLAKDLRSLPAICQWVTDYSSHAMVERRKQSPLSQKMKSAPFQFNPTDWVEFFAKQGWKLKTMRYFGDEARARRRPAPFPLKIRLMMHVIGFIRPHLRDQFRKSSGFMLLERAA